MQNQKSTFVIPIVIFSLLVLSSCGLIMDRGYKEITIQEGVDVRVKQGDLFAKAIKITGVYDNLSTDQYPLTLFYPRDMSSYLLNKGLSEEEFLSHAKLADFVNAHLIPNIKIEFKKIKGVPIHYKNALGDMVEFKEGTKTSENLVGVLADDIPIQGCSQGYNPDATLSAWSCVLGNSLVDFSWDK